MAYFSRIRRKTDYEEREIKRAYMTLEGISYIKLAIIIQVILTVAIIGLAVVKIGLNFRKNPSYILTSPSLGMHIVSGLVGLLVSYLFYKGFESLAEAYEDLTIGKYGAGLLALAYALNLYPLFSGLAGLLALVGGILTLIGFWRLGEYDVTGRLHRGVILFILGSIFLIIIIGIILIIASLIDTLNGLNSIEKSAERKLHPQPKPSRKPNKYKPT